MDLSNIPLKDGWAWHKWSASPLGFSTRWLAYTRPEDRWPHFFRCVDCGWECTDARSISGHNQKHDRTPDERRRQDTPSGLRNVHHREAAVCD